MLRHRAAYQGRGVAHRSQHRQAVGAADQRLPPQISYGIYVYHLFVPGLLIALLPALRMLADRESRTASKLGKIRGRKWGGFNARSDGSRERAPSRCRTDTLVDASMALAT